MGDESYKTLTYQKQGEVHVFVEGLKLSHRILELLGLSLSFKVEDPWLTFQRMNTPGMILSLRDHPPRVTKDFQSNTIDTTLLNTCVSELPSYTQPTKLRRTMDGARQKTRTVTQELDFTMKYHQQSVKIATRCLVKAQALIVPCDKNMGVAVFPIKSYVELCLDFLLNSTSFIQSTEEELLKRAFLMTQVELVSLYGEDWSEPELPSEPIMQVLSKSDCQYLMENMPLFYALLKIQKKPLKPRPIVSMENTAWTPMDKLLAFVFRSIVTWTLDTKKMRNKHVVTTIQHSQEAVQRLEHMVQKDCIRTLASGDITELYTKLDHSVIVRAVGFWLEYFAPNEKFSQPKERQRIMRLTQLFLDNLGFHFLGRFFFTQPCGIPMGAICSPDLATLTLTFIEYTSWPSICRPLGIDSTIVSAGLVCIRYLDDILTDETLVPHFRAAYETFGLSLNVVSSITPTNCSENKEGHTTEYLPQCVFLDLNLSIDLQKRKLLSDLYCKPGKANTYLHYHSANPNSHYKGLIYGYIFRVYRGCNQHQLHQGHIDTLRKLLLERGVPSNVLDRTIELAQYEVRQWLYDETAQQAREFAKLALHKQEKRGGVRIIPDTSLPLSQPYNTTPPTWISIEHHPRLLASLIPLSNAHKWFKSHDLDLNIQM